ncbi:MAG: hypothetical protein H6741_19395 [Alphaproteobacteria bacterium]|nr:hypothetical protein [Alphaproteobacteria bacterium]
MPRLSLRERALALALLLAGLWLASRVLPWREQVLAPVLLEGFEEGALAQVDGDGPVVLRAYADGAGHAPLPPAARGTWRDGPGAGETPQSFPAYLASDPVRATAQRDTIVIVPLGDDPLLSELSHQIAAFASIFFGAPARVLEPAALPADGRRPSRGYGEQANSALLLDALLLPMLPDDAIVGVGVTMQDLYPGEGWNFVFGQARLEERVGVYSLARYRPEQDAADPQLMLRRALKVFAHETGHAFSMRHCMHYTCLMNGSNSLVETDAQPLHLCPVCASKITWNRGLDPALRYQGLADWFAEVGLDEEADWAAGRVR